MYQKSTISTLFAVILLLLLSCELSLNEESATYSVTFDTNGGSLVSAQTIQDGETVVPVAEPTKDNASFQGWFKEPDCVTPWNFTIDIVSQDITLYAKWLQTTFYINLLANGGSGTIEPIAFESTSTTLPLIDDQITRDGYKFISWNTAADRSGTEYRQQSTVTLTDTDITLYAQWYPVYAVGDAGPAGGLIFYSKNLDAIFSYPEWVYMEAAPASTEVDIAWGGQADPTTTVEFGSGLENTNIITNSFTGNYAAHHCQNLVAGGYDDWFLPSRPELAYMCNNLFLQGLGDFENEEFYWSSSERSDDKRYAYIIIFDSDYNPLTMVNPHSKMLEFNVRAARRF